jgi:hypothetical protein
MTSRNKRECTVDNSQDDDVDILSEDDEDDSADDSDSTEDDSGSMEDDSESMEDDSESMEDDYQDDNEFFISIDNQDDAIDNQDEVDDPTFYMNGLLRWIQDEGKKNDVIVQKEEWTLIDHGREFPQQGNGYDCGTFAIVCADHLIDDLPVTGSESSFSQTNMPFWREKIGVDILRGKLRY